MHSLSPGVDRFRLPESLTSSGQARQENSHPHANGNWGRRGIAEKEGQGTREWGLRLTGRRGGGTTRDSGDRSEDGEHNGPKAAHWLWVSHLRGCYFRDDGPQLPEGQGSARSSRDLQGLRPDPCNALSLGDLVTPPRAASPRTSAPPLCISFSSCRQPLVLGLAPDGRSRPVVPLAGTLLLPRARLLVQRTAISGGGGALPPVGVYSGQRAHGRHSPTRSCRWSS